MHVVSPDYVSHQPHSAPPTPSPQQPKAAMPTSRTRKLKQRRRRDTKKKQHPYDKWVKTRLKIQDADITRKTVIEKLAALLRLLLPYGSTFTGQPMLPPVTPDVKAGVMVEAPETASPSLPFLSRAHEGVFASPIKRSLSMDSDEGEASYVPGEGTVKAFSEQKFGAVASPYIATYVFRTGNIDRDFGMRRDVDGTFRIGNVDVKIDQDSNVFDRANHIRGPGYYWNY